MSDAFLRRYGYVNPKKLPKFEFTGVCETYQDASGWMISLKTSGDLTFISKLPDGVDVFLVGGGAGGRAGGGSATGGAGGRTATVNKLMPSRKVGYPIVIGAGGAGGVSSGSGFGQNGQPTKAFGFEVAGGTAYETIQLRDSTVYVGGSGGSGGGTPTYNYQGYVGESGRGGSDGGNGGSARVRYAIYGGYEDGYARGGYGQGYTTRAFGESSGMRFASGGGCGGIYVNNQITSDPTNGGEGDTIAYLGNINTGGGSGGTAGETSGTVGGSAAPNSGSGGGGGGMRSESYGTYDGGAGGSGVVIIRNAR